MVMHAGQLTVSLDTVRALLAEQFPTWRDLPVTGITTQGTAVGASPAPVVAAT